MEADQHADTTRIVRSEQVFIQPMAIQQVAVTTSGRNTYVFLIDTLCKERRGGKEPQNQQTSPFHQKYRIGRT